MADVDNTQDILNNLYTIRIPRCLNYYVPLPEFYDSGRSAEESITNIPDILPKTLIEELKISYNYAREKSYTAFDARKYQQIKRNTRRCKTVHAVPKPEPLFHIYNYDLSINFDEFTKYIDSCSELSKEQKIQLVRYQQNILFKGSCNGVRSNSTIIQILLSDINAYEVDTIVWFLRSISPVIDSEDNMIYNIQMLDDKKGKIIIAIQRGIVYSEPLSKLNENLILFEKTENLSNSYKVINQKKKFSEAYYFGTHSPQERWKFDHYLEYFKSKYSDPEMLSLCEKEFNEGRSQCFNQNNNRTFSSASAAAMARPPHLPLHPLYKIMSEAEKPFGIIDFGITGISSKKMKEYWHDMCNKEPKYFSRPGKGLGKHSMWIHINSEWSVVDENSSDFGW